MKAIIKNISRSIDDRSISFTEKFYFSYDEKSVMGEVAFREILFLDYRDSEAGSNPREYKGLGGTNSNILKSLLKDPENMFRFLHSGIIVSLTNAAVITNNKSIKYEESCLTNGNQTRFIILIIIVLKMLISKKLKQIRRKDFDGYIRNNWGKNDKIMSILSRVRFNKILEIVTFLNSNGKYRVLFEKLALNKFLDCKIRIQINLINNIVSDIQSKLSEYEAGTLIAEANNDTQNVKVDDIFGNKYKKELTERIFNKFNAEYGGQYAIEYRFKEVIDQKEKVHILTLLRPVVATGIITKDKDIFKLTNQRNPVYKLFEKLLERNKTHKCIEIIQRLIPILFDLRIKYVIPHLDNFKRVLIRQYKEKALSHDLDENLVIWKDIEAAKGSQNKIERIIKTQVGYNIEHILPVLVYTLRRLFVEAPDGKKIDIAIDPEEKGNFIKSLIEIIYTKYVETKMKGLPTSLTTFVRREEFYNFGRDAYILQKNRSNLKESDLIEKNRCIIA